MKPKAQVISQVSTGQSHPTHRYIRNRSGSQVIEMALGFGVLIFMIMGMVEFGQFLYIRHCIQSAVRDGARCGILASATQTQMVSTITSTLLNANITYNSNWLTVTDLTAGSTVTDISQATQGDQLEFTISTTYGNIPNAYRPLYSMTGLGIGPNKKITSSCILIKE